MAAAKRFNSKVAAALGTYADEDIFARLTRIREGETNFGWKVFTLNSSIIKIKIGRLQLMIVNRALLYQKI